MLWTFLLTGRRHVRSGNHVIFEAAADSVQFENELATRTLLPGHRSLSGISPTHCRLHLIASCSRTTWWSLIQRFCLSEATYVCHCFQTAGSTLRQAFHFPPSKCRLTLSCRRELPARVMEWEALEAANEYHFEEFVIRQWPVYQHGCDDANILLIEFDI
jgi:hypothetical protein